MAKKHHPTWAPTPLDQALAAQVGDDVAFLPAGDEVWAVRWRRRGSEPRSALLELVRAVWARDPDRAFAILRTRIRLTSPPAPFDPDVVRLAARRWALVPAGPPVPLPTVVWLEPPAEPLPLPIPTGPRSIGEWMGWARGQRRTSSAPRPRADRAVVAVLVGADGSGLRAAHNTAGSDRTAHAEVALLRGWWSERGAVPPGSTLVTTLQCCRMCAALWADGAPPDLQVVMGAIDPGPFARGTRLAQREVAWEGPA